MRDRDPADAKGPKGLGWALVWGDLGVNEAQEGQGKDQARRLRGAEPECQLALVVKDSQLLRFERNHERAFMLRWDKRWRSDANEAAGRSKIMSDVTDQSYIWTLKSRKDSEIAISYVTILSHSLKTILRFMFPLRFFHFPLSFIVVSVSYYNLVKLSFCFISTLKTLNCISN